jgi:cytochrome b561
MAYRQPTDPSGDFGMPTRSTTATWGSVTRNLHWISAIVVLGLLGHGWWMTHMAVREVRLWHYGTHGLIAVYFALLLALRLVWRLSEATPHQPTGTPDWQKLAAHGAHILLYLLLIGMVVTGYLMWSSLPNRFDPARAANFDYSLFGIFKLPGVHAVGDRPTTKYWESIHELMSHALQVLVLVHIAAALWHQFVKRDTVLARMTHGRD